MINNDLFDPYLPPARKNAFFSMARPDGNASARMLADRRRSTRSQSLRPRKSSPAKLPTRLPERRAVWRVRIRACGQNAANRTDLVVTRGATQACGLSTDTS